MSKCYRILELSLINVPVVAQYYAQRQEIAVSIAHIPTSTAHLDRRNLVNHDREGECTAVHRGVSR